MTTILVVDDDPGIVKVVRAYLEKAGFQVLVAYDGKKALHIARHDKPHLVILDLMLPEMDGWDVCRALRRESDVPIIMLTARVEDTDKLIGLELGADDYVTKPFSPRELVARVKAALRRLHATDKGLETKVLPFRHVRIDVGSHRVWVDDELVELTAMEFDLLRTLAEHHGLVLSREQLLERIWGRDFYGEERVVDVHIGHIRRKLGNRRLIETVRGVGYRFEDEPL